MDVSPKVIEPLVSDFDEVRLRRTAYPFVGVKRVVKRREAADVPALAFDRCTPHVVTDQSFRESPSSERYARREVTDEFRVVRLGDTGSLPEVVNPMVGYENCRDVGEVVHGRIAVWIIIDPWIDHQTDITIADPEHRVPVIR